MLPTSAEAFACFFFVPHNSPVPCDRTRFLLPPKIWLANVMSTRWISAFIRLQIYKQISRWTSRGMLGCIVNRFKGSNSIKNQSMIYLNLRKIRAKRITIDSRTKGFVRIITTPKVVALVVLNTTLLSVEKQMSGKLIER